MYSDIKECLRRDIRNAGDTAKSKQRSEGFYVPSVNNDQEPFPCGELSVSPCWYPQGNHTLLASSPVLKTHIGLNFFRTANESLALLGSALWLLHPKLAVRGSAIMEAIRNGTVKEPKANKEPNATPWWPSPFTTMGFISNRKIDVHHDHKGFERFYDILTTLGDYSDGKFRVPGLGVVFEYNPGTMIAVCGKVLGHSVGEVNGNRLCLAQYFHQEVLNHHGASGDIPHQDYDGWMTSLQYRSIQHSGSRWIQKEHVSTTT